MRLRTRTPRPSPQGAPGPQGALGAVLGTLTRSRAAATVALLVCACTLPSTATALATTQPANESLAIFEGQLNGHQVSTVTLGTKAHAFRVVLADGHIVRVVFPPSQQQQLMKNIEAAGITVKVAKVQPQSHKRRYLVWGVVVVLIILAAIGLTLSARRRRMREEV
jgi:ATP-dependent Zn protease